MSATGIGAAVGIGRVGSIVGPALAALMIGAGRTPVQVLEGLLPIVIACVICIAVVALPAKPMQAKIQVTERPGAGT